jgi:formylglycine-generating enzyme required for sulfatase activity
MFATALLLGLLSPYTPAVAETRLALIVTNARYPIEVGALANPHKDGDLIAAALKGVGFAQNNIAIVRDTDQAALRLAMAEFIERIEKAGPQAVAFFYYSGHGAADRTDRGENYLIPVGAKITLARQLPILGVSLTEITKSLERVPAKARFVVVDACRNVAFTKGIKDAHKGFVAERRLDGIIVAFATRPGETAEDNNIYAGALASVLPTPGLTAEQVFKETQLKVADLSKGQQIPWIEDGLLTRFRFKEAVAAAAPPPSQPAPLAPAQPAAPVAPQPPPPSRCNGVEALVGSERRCLKPGSGKSEWFKDCPYCPEMVVVPAGRFTTGSPVDEPERWDWEDQVSVAIGQPFAVGRFPVTRTEFAVFVSATAHENDGCKILMDNDWKQQADRSWRSPGFWQTERHPAVCINWNDAKAYVTWLSSETGKTYQLLSEAEREYAARAGTTKPFWWGSTITASQANYDGNYIYAGGSKGEYRKATVSVESFSANPWGLYNVHGNVSEWTEDCWNDKHVGNPGDGNARMAGDCSSRVDRGGSWVNHPRFLRSAVRFRGVPDVRISTRGFRVARTLAP